MKSPGLGEVFLQVSMGRWGLPARSLPWETRSEARRGCPLGGPGRRWGRWEEIELAGPLHREERALASGRGTEEEMQPRSLAGRSHSRSEMPKQEMRCNL